jgi:hypothetical protein
MGQDRQWGSHHSLTPQSSQDQYTDLTDAVRRRDRVATVTQAYEVRTEG